MSNVVELGIEAADAMARLHQSAFASQSAWNVKAFQDLMQLETSLAYGIYGETLLDGLILLQVTAFEAEVLTLCVAPVARGQGLGHLLLKTSRDWLMERGLERLILEVAADNDAALQLYQKNGFSETSRRANYYARSGGQSADAILMLHSFAGQSAMKGA